MLWTKPFFWLNNHLSVINLHRGTTLLRTNLIKTSPQITKSKMRRRPPCWKLPNVNLERHVTTVIIETYTNVSLIEMGYSPQNGTHDNLVEYMDCRHKQWQTLIMTTTGGGHLLCCKTEGKPSCQERHVTHQLLGYIDYSVNRLCSWLKWFLCNQLVENFKTKWLQSRLMIFREIAMR